MISSVSTEKSQLAVRMPTGRRPATFSSTSAARKVRSRSTPGGSPVLARGSRNGCRSRGPHRPRRAPLPDAAGRRRRGRRSWPGRRAASSSRRMRGMPWREPYWPWLIRIGLSSPSRSGWSHDPRRRTAPRSSARHPARRRRQAAAAAGTAHDAAPDRLLPGPGLAFGMVGGCHAAAPKVAPLAAPRIVTAETIRTGRNLP
jgi:hypothetical protein